MTRKIKLFSILLCCAFFFTAFGLAFANYGGKNKVSADGGTPITVDQISELKMQDGAYIRLVDGAIADKCGIAYSFSMKSDEYTALISNVGSGKVYSEIKFGVFIASANFNSEGHKIADENNLLGENAIYYWQVAGDSQNPVFNVDNPDTNSMKRIVCAEGTQMRIDDDGNAYFQGSIVDMLDENITREFIGVGFIKYTAGSETHYKFATAGDNVRTMEQVARVAYKEKPELQTALKDLYLSKTVRDCEVVTAPTGIENLVYTGSAQALITAGVSDDYSTMQYSLDNSTWSEDIPTATEIGSYTVYYKAVSKTDFDNDSEVNNITVQISLSKQGTLTLKPGTVREVKEGGTLVGFTGDYDRVGLGSYSVGDVLEFSFKGKNIPNVALFASENGVNCLGGGSANTGLFVQTSCYYGPAYNSRWYVVGPFLLDAGSVAPYRELAGRSEYSYSGTLGNNIALGQDISNTGNTSLISMGQLDDNTDYIYRLSSVDGNSSTVTIIADLYKKNGTSIEKVKSISKTITHYLSSLENRYAVVYGAGAQGGTGLTAKDITFDYVINPDYDITVTKGTLTLNYATGITHSNSGNKGTYDYQGLGRFNVGDALEFTFTGKNIPNVALFANKNGVNCIGGAGANTGLFIQTSGYNSTYNGRLYFTGPFLLDAGSPTPYEPLNIDNFTYSQEICKNKDIAVQTNSSFAMSNLTDDTNYVYRIETAESQTTNYVVIKVYLYSVNGEGVRSEIANYTFDRPHFLQTFGGLDNTYAIVYGAGSYHAKAITFSYELLPKA